MNDYVATDLTNTTCNNGFKIIGKHFRLNEAQLVNSNTIKSFKKLDKHLAYSPDRIFHSCIIFLLYINNFFLSTPNSSTRLFADDSLLYRAVKTSDDCTLLQQDLDALQHWEYTWKMHVHPDKCKFLSFTRSHKPIHHTYAFHNIQIEFVNSYKYLDVHLSTDLKFNTHIDS